MKIYSGIFLEDGSHVTFDFNPGEPSLPNGVEEGDVAVIEVVGEYSDDLVSCEIVEVDGLRTQCSKNTLLHITTWLADGVKAFQSGLRATKNADKISYFENSKIKQGVWDFFEI